jgi:hypothetical protein
MKLLPLNAKKKLSKFMGWFDFGAAMFVVLGSFIGGIGGMVGYERLPRPGGTAENTSLTQKADHLLTSYEKSKAMHVVVLAAEKGEKLGVDLTQAKEADAKITADFNAEAQAVGIAVAGARHINPHQRYELYKKLEDIKPHPDYFKSGATGDEDLLLFTAGRAHVMKGSNAAPTIEQTRKIVAFPSPGVPLVMACIFGPLALGIGGVWGFCAARRRLDNSIYAEEKAIKEAEQARRDAELAAQRAEQQKEKDEANRLAENVAREAAELERRANLPAAVAEPLEHDISVRQIRLTDKNKPSTG